MNEEEELYLPFTILGTSNLQMHSSMFKKRKNKRQVISSRTLFIAVILCRIKIRICDLKSISQRQWFLCFGLFFHYTHSDFLHLIWHGTKLLASKSVF